MIIDLILDRKDGIPYSPREFYQSVMEYGPIGHGIAEAMDSGEEEDVKRELATYIANNGYNPEIIDYTNRQEWLTN